MNPERIITLMKELEKLDYIVIDFVAYKDTFETTAIFYVFDPFQERLLHVFMDTKYRKVRYVKRIQEDSL